MFVFHRKEYGKLYAICVYQVNPAAPAIPKLLRLEMPQKEGQMRGDYDYDYDPEFRIFAFSLILTQPGFEIKRSSNSCAGVSSNFKSFHQILISMTFFAFRRAYQ